MKKITQIIGFIFVFFTLMTVGCIDVFTFNGNITTHESHPTSILYTISYGYLVNCSGTGNYEIKYDCDEPEVLSGSVLSILVHDNTSITKTIATYNKMKSWIIRSSISKQYDLGIKVPHVASSAASMPTVHKLVGAGMEGVYVEAAALPNFDPDPKIQAWTKKYEEKFKTKPDSFAILYYDTANFLFEAIKAVGPDRAKIRGWLEKNRYQGLAGQYKFDREHNGAYFAIIVQYHMKDDKAVPTLIKKYDFTPK